MGRIKKYAGLSMFLVLPLLAMAAMSVMVDAQPVDRGGYTLPNGDKYYVYGPLSWSSQGTNTTLDTLVTTTPDTTVTWIDTYGADQIGLYIETTGIYNQDDVIFQMIGSVMGDIYDGAVAVDTLVDGNDGLDYNHPFTSAHVTTAAQYARIKLIAIQDGGAATDSVGVKVWAKVLFKKR